MFEKIMVPLDGARAGGKTVRYAEELAEKFGSELILFRVVSQASVPSTGMM